MNNEKMREAFEAWARRNLTEVNDQSFKRMPVLDHLYDNGHIEALWQCCQAFTAATQRDAMAVAEAVRKKAWDMWGRQDFHDHPEEVDLAAIVEAVRPGMQHVAGNGQGVAHDSRHVAACCMNPCNAAAADVLAERRRQVETEGWTPEHDDAHQHGQLAGAAACYALTSAQHWMVHLTIKQLWPWDYSWFKPSTPRRDLVKAGALILAEIERLDRAAPKPEGA